MLKKLLDKYKKLPVQVKASLWFLVCSVMQRGISVITTPIFTRLMPTGDYGQYGAFNSWLNIISVFVTLRIYYGVFVQGLVKYDDDQDRYASAMQGLGLTLSLAWTVIYILFHNFWNQLLGLTTVQMFAMLVMIWAAGSFRFWASEQRVHYKYRTLVAVTIIISILKPLIGILFVIHAEDKVTARILGIALVEFVGYCFGFFAQMKRGKTFYSKKYWRHALMFNLPLIPHYLSQTALNSADRIMIRDMVGASEAGIYSLAYSISSIMTMFTQALTQTLTPWIYQKIKMNRPKDIKKVAYPSLLGMAAVNILLIAFAPEIVRFFAPKAYYDAIWVIPPVAMSVYFTYSYHLFACFQFYFEKTRFVMIASFAGAALNIVLNYIFIKMFGYYAAGYTTLVCYMVYAIGHFLFMRKVCREYLDGIEVYDLRILLIITGLFLATGFAFLFSYTNAAIRYSLIIMLIVLLIIKRKTVIGGLKQLFGQMVEGKRLKKHR